jgi:ssDNA-binding Zn-finger/Zn-ribbon topoisomerase 1/very-short-patch-repair endonuclease
VGEVDPQSGREAAVLDWFYQTRFWREEKARIKFTPQFELGKYLKQLDPEYTDPAYRVDFLLLYRSDANIEKKIIIEYDGFKEHFGEVEGVDASNYSDYYSEEDVYRQKVLESYGYKFLRINRFNLGIDPIATIDTRLRVLVGNRSASPRNDVLDAIHIKIKRLQDGDLKECPKCKKLRNAEDFKDDSLSTGAGRFCRFCKGLDPQTGVATTAAPRVVCPKCGARMVLRESQYGPFYGCSTYPACRGTVKQTQPEQGSVGRETCPPR